MFSFDAESGEIYLYDVIGPEDFGYISDGMVIDALKKIGKKHAHIRINSPGGSVDSGVAIFNALRRHKAGATTYNDSLAASISSYIFLAGEKRIAAENSKLMIHRAWSFAMGNAAELRKAAEVLEKYEESVIPEYAKASGKTAEEVVQIMDAESWYVGNEAVDAGWATELEGVKNVQPVITGLMEISKHAPKSLFEKREAIRAELSSGHRFPKLEAVKQMRARLASVDKNGLNHISSLRI
jgi:ATP-dependent Clp protease, protease subunit